MEVTDEMLAGAWTFAHRLLPQLMTMFARSALPQAWIEQSRIPKPKLVFLHRQEMSLAAQPKSEAFASMFVPQVFCDLLI